MSVADVQQQQAVRTLRDYLASHAPEDTESRWECEASERD